MTTKKKSLYIYFLSYILLFLIIAAFLPKGNALAIENYTLSKGGKIVYRAQEERESVCTTMNQMAEVKWKLSKPVTYKYKSDSTITLLPGHRRGIPYTQYYRIYPDISKVQDNMNLAQTPTTSTVINTETGEEETLTIENPVLGLDCSSALAYAFRFATGNETSYNTFLMGGENIYKSHQFLFDGMRNGYGSATTVKGVYLSYRDDLSKIGYYGNYSGYSYANDTETIIENLNAPGNYSYGTIYDNVYGKLKPGDILVRVRKNGSGHVMLVSRVKIKYTSDGLIDPIKSQIYIIDQSSPDRSVFSDGSLSSWRNNNTFSSETKKANNIYSFRYMAMEMDAIPITLWPDNSVYTISYTQNGDSDTYSTVTKHAYRPVQIPNKTPIRAGYSFDGWKSTTNPAGLIYHPGDPYFEESDDTLEAQWTANSGRILFDPTAGSGGPKYQTQYYDKGLKITSNIPVLKGYKFMGWATTPDAEAAEYQPGDYFTDDSRLKEGSGDTVTLYALWQKTVAEADVELSEDEVYYTGETFIPDYTVTHLGNVLTEGIDYTVTLPTSPKTAGKYTIKITGIGEFTGTYKATYSILKYDQKIDVKSSYKKVFNAKSFNLNATAETSISYKSSNKSVAEVSSNGKINIHDVGTATITLTAKSTSMFNRAKKEVTITVKPRSTDTTRLTSKRKSITVNWARHTSELTGYQIKISRHKSMSNAREIKIANRYTSSYKITHLKPGKRYYIQIRTYRTTNGKTYYSSWSKKHRMKTKPPKEDE